MLQGFSYLVVEEGEGQISQPLSRPGARTWRGPHEDTVRASLEGQEATCALAA